MGLKKKKERDREREILCFYFHFLPLGAEITKTLFSVAASALKKYV